MQTPNSPTCIRHVLTTCPHVVNWDRAKIPNFKKRMILVFTFKDALFYDTSALALLLPIRGMQTSTTEDPEFF